MGAAYGAHVTGIHPDEASRRGLRSTFCAPVGNLAPDGSIIKATAIDPAVIDPDGVYRFEELSVCLGKAL